MQTRNAVGNLVNRYRAVLKKCNIMNVFGSLAIAGMLVMGSSVGVAVATGNPGKNSESWTTSTGLDNTYDETEVITAAGDIKSLTVNITSDAAGNTSDKPGVNYTNGVKYTAGTTTSNISGTVDITKGMFSLNNNSSKIIAETTTNIGAGGALNVVRGEYTAEGELTLAAGGNIYLGWSTAKLNIKTGDLNIGVGSTVATGDGHINLTGTDGSTMGDINVTQGNLEIGHPGSTPALVSLTAGAINLGTDEGSLAAESAHMSFGNTSSSAASVVKADVNIFNNGFLEVKTSVKGKIDGDVFATGGKINAGAELSIGNGTAAGGLQVDNMELSGNAKLTAIIIDIDGVASGNGLFVSGNAEVTTTGAITVTGTSATSGTATLSLTENARLLNNGGTIALAGDANGAGILTVSDEAFVVTDALTVAANTTFDATTLHIDKVAAGRTDTGTAWAVNPSSSLTGVYTGAYTHTGGTTTVGELKMVAGAADYVGGSFLNEIKIVAGEFNIDGGELTTIGHANRVEVNAGTFNVKGDVTVTKNGNAPGGILVLGTSGSGNIGSGQYAAATGGIFIGGNLDASAGGAAFHGTAGTAIATVVDTMKIQGTTSTNNTVIGTGGRDTFKGNATINLGALDIIKRDEALIGATKLVLDSTQGDINFIGLGDEGTFFTGDEISTAKTGGLTFGGDAINPFDDSTIKVLGGETEAKITATASDKAFEVKSGNWTIGALNATATGAATITAGILTINGTNDEALTSDTSGDIAIGGSGMLKVVKGAVFDATTTNRHGTLEEIATVEGSIISFTSGFAEGSVTLSGVKGLFDKVATGGGLLQFEKGVIGVSDDDRVGGVGSGAIISDKIEGSGAVLVDETVNYADGAVTVTGDTAAVDIAGDYGAQKIDITVGAGVNKVTATVDGALTLTGDGTSLISTSANVKTDVAIAAGETLTLGVAGETSGGTLKGDIALADAAAKVQVNNGAFTVGALGENIANGVVDVNTGAALTTSTITVKELKSTGGTLTANGEVEIATLTASDNAVLNFNAGATLDADSTLTGGSTLIVKGGLTTDNEAIVVGNEEGAGNLYADSLQLGTGALLMDPDFGKPSSVVVIGKFGDVDAEDDVVSTLTGKVGVGMNSKLIVGGTLADLDAELKEMGVSALDETGISAAMYIAAPQVIKTGAGIVVDGSLKTADFSNSSNDGGKIIADTIVLANNSLLVIDMDGLTEAADEETKADNAAVTFETSGTIKIDTGSVGNAEDQAATVRLANAKAGSYTLTDNAQITDQNGDAADETEFKDGLVIANDMLVIKDVYLSANNTDTGYSNITLAVDDLKNIAGFEKFDNNLYGLTKAYLESKAENHFLDSTLNSAALTGAQKADTIEGAAKIGVAAGAISSTTSVANAGSANVGNRTTMVNTYVADSGVMQLDGDNMNLVAVADASAGAGGMQNGIGLWVQPMYQHTSADGFDSGAYEYGYDSDLFGISVGTDYTFNNSLRVGIAAHMGSGDSDSTGDFASTENDFDYFGFSLYTGYMIGNIGLSADIGYTMTDNEVTQKSNVGNIDADFDANTFTAGVRAEYKFALQALDVVPHIGMRLNYTDVESYSSKYAGGTAFDTDDSDSTTFAIPVGVTLQKDITTASGMIVRPSLDLGMQFTMGDLDVDQDVRIPGVVGSASMESEIFDAVTFQGGLGIGVTKGAMDFDLDYNINASSNVTSHGVFGTFRYNF